MDLVTAARMIARRWVVLVLALAVVGGVMYGLQVKLKPTYTASATMLLLPPLTGGTSQPGPAVVDPRATPTPGPKVINPYLSFDASLYVLARIITQAMGSDETRAQLKAAGFTASYTVTSSSEEPSITFTATDHDPANTLGTVQHLVVAANASLINRQRSTGTPDNTLATSTVLDLPTRAKETRDKLKVMGIGGAVGVIAAFTLTFIVESLLEGRRRRRQGPSIVRTEEPRLNLDKTMVIDRVSGRARLRGG